MTHYIADREAAIKAFHFRLDKLKNKRQPFNRNKFSKAHTLLRIKQNAETKQYFDHENILEPVF